MSNGLYIPPGSRIVPVRGLPIGDLKLSDGRQLQFVQGAPLPREADEFTRFLASGEWRGKSGLCVLGSMDDTPHGALLHISMSYRDRDPDWATIKAVRDAFYPDTIDVMMVLPKAEDYVNIHAHVFHLWQTPRTWGLR